MNSRSVQTWCGKALLAALVATGILAACAVMMDLRVDADDAEDPRAPVREHPAPGTRFWFEVIESFNAKYQGDTAGHIGRGGGYQFIRMWHSAIPFFTRSATSTKRSEASRGCDGSG